MRILQVTHGFPPESVGGVEQHVEGLSQALAKKGEAVHVYARTSDASMKQGEFRSERSGNPEVTRAAFRWEGIDGLTSMYRCAPMADTLRQFLRSQQEAGLGFNVAHVHHLTGMSVDSLDVLREAQIPVVLTLHDYWLMCPRGQMWNRREESCERVEPQRCGECLSQTFPFWVNPQGAQDQASALHDLARSVLAKADQLVIPSARAIPPFAALGVDPASISVVENGVDTEALDSLPLPSFGPGPLRLGYLGTVMPSKGLHVLLDAVLQQPESSVELHIHQFPKHAEGKLGEPHTPEAFRGLSQPAVRRSVPVSDRQLGHEGGSLVENGGGRGHGRSWR
jgi:glycosyltransferase involved in cell wall biosynthesis